jgi:hypothetical protein
MQRFWFAVRCGWFVGAFQAQQAEAAAYLALQQWVAEREGCADSLWPCPITIVVPAGGQAPEDYLHLRTHDLLSNLGLLPRETAIRAGFTLPRRLGTSSAKTAPRRPREQPPA